MAECPHCNEQISHAQMFLLNFKIKKKCSYCGCRLYETKKSRNRQFFMIYFPLSFFIGILTAFGIPFGFVMLSFVACLLLLLLILPKFQSYSTEEEPWF
ncbi:TIGR04104 family putative zinc finger protein [Alkalihalobacterium bogoriense]|uniref:TIGR04104 family putative zinc finger protein n=1 Tax=Alkalihalobacterium bogoriense TaxID=246272 RepID=UPI00047BC92F